ncbi:MAG TPA: DUF1990 domain-containing protein [Thermoanaerobaculia bacterium]
MVRSPAAVFLFSKPDRRQIDRFLAAQRNRTFSYRETGASLRAAPAGYTVDHNRVQIGEGRAAFARAVEALRSWKQLDLGWVTAHPPSAPLEPGVTVAVRARHFGFWSLNACRVVYTLEEEGAMVRFGFAYGTLPDHAELGEERFTVEWHHEDGAVWYDLFAFSRPNHALASFGRPFSRRLQRRFARDSMRAMARAAAAQWPAGGRRPR